jgi:hypothetical protein
MPIRIVTNTIAELQRKQWTEFGVKAGIGNREGDYEIRIDASDQFSSFSIHVDGPEGTFQRTFDGQWKDVNFIRNYFDRVIPRPIPLSRDVLCDDCVRVLNGTVIRMEAVIVLFDGHQRAGDAYVCRHHGRIWHQSTGYISANRDSLLGRNPFRPVCVECEETMYMEFAESTQNVRFRCPECNHWGFGPLPNLG